MTAFPAWRGSKRALLLCVVFAAPHDALPVTGADPDIAWKAYLDNDANIEPSHTFPHATCFRAAALAHGLPETLLLAVARGESDFESGARSRATAHGVMQILWPGTANHLGIFRLT